MWFDDHRNLTGMDTAVIPQRGQPLIGLPVLGSWFNVHVIEHRPVFVWAGPVPDAGHNVPRL